MPAKKGQPKVAGREKGTPNKSTQDLEAICAKHNVNVFEAMVILAVTTDDDDKKFQRLEAVSKYLYAKRKEVEHSGGIEAIRLIVEDYSSKK
jgi:hypothetical protein